MPAWRQQVFSQTNTSGDRIRNARHAKHMTQRELAAAIGKSETSIILIEGNKSKPSLPTLKALSEVLNVPIQYLGVFEHLPVNTFGQKFHKARLFQGLTKAAAAKIFNVDAKTIWGWETDNHIPLEQYKTKIDSFISMI